MSIDIYMGVVENTNNSVGRCLRNSSYYSMLVNNKSEGIVLQNVSDYIDPVGDIIMSHIQSKVGVYRFKNQE